MNQIRRPLVAALLSHLVGLLLALRLTLPVAAPTAAFALAIAVAIALPELTKRWDRAGSVALTLFALTGAITGSAAAERAATDCRLRIPDDARISVHGVLAAAHREEGPGTGRPLLPLVRATSGESGCKGEIRVRMPAGEEELLVGSTVTAFGTWRTFSRPLVRSEWPSDPRYHGFLLADSVQVDRNSPAPPWLLARRWTDNRILELFPDHGPIVEALILGRREYLDPAVRDRYTRSGLSHLLAISGMHVALLAGALLLLGAICRVGHRSVLRATMVVVWLYLLVIGAPASAVRSGVMITVALLAALLQRPFAPLAAVSAAALVILAFQPLAILQPGFQLSFLGVLGILACRPMLLRAVPARLRRRGPARHLADAAIVGVAAFLATAPVVAHHFGTVAPISMLAGIPAVPLMSLALVGALGSILLRPVLQPLATLLADGAALALEMLDRVAGWAADFPLGHTLVPPPPWWLWSAAAAAALLVWRVGSYSSALLRRTAVSGSALAIFILWPLAAQTRPAGMEVHFIDVGQGDAIALRSPANRWILIDAGPASTEYDSGERRVLPFLRLKGARRLEALVLTHPDLDHIGGAAAVLRALPVKHVFEPGLPVGRDPYLELLHTIADHDVDWRAARTGRSIQLDGIRMDILWPDPQAIDALEDANEISAILKITYGDFSMLLTGDAGVGVEQTLVARHGQGIQADILKLGHHGSSTSSAPDFLDVVKPELAIVSAGRRNRYGHPAPSVLARVSERQIPIARTDQDGTLSLSIAQGGSAWRLEEW